MDYAVTVVPFDAAGILELSRRTAAALPGLSSRELGALLPAVAARARARESSGLTGFGVSAGTPPFNRAVSSLELQAPLLGATRSAIPRSGALRRFAE